MTDPTLLTTIQGPLLTGGTFGLIVKGNEIFQFIRNVVMRNGSNGTNGNGKKQPCSTFTGADHDTLNRIDQRQENFTETLTGGFRELRESLDKIEENTGRSAENTARLLERPAKPVVKVITPNGTPKRKSRKGK